MAWLRLCLVWCLGLLWAHESSARQGAANDLDDVGQVSVGAGDAQRRVLVPLELGAPKPGTRPFCALAPAVIELLDNPSVNVKTLPPLRSSRPRYATLRLGRGGRQVVILDQSQPTTSHYDMLWIDRDRDMSFESANELTPVMGSVVHDDEFDVDYVEFTAVSIDLYFGVRVDAGGAEVSSIEPRLFTFYARHPRIGVLDRLYCVAASWREGAAKVDGLDVRVVVYDESATGLHAIERDRWAVVEIPASEPLPEGIELAPMAIPQRIGGRPYRVITLEPEGRSVEIGEESEASALQSMLDTDPLQSEPPRPRTQNPVVWLNDYAVAEAQSKAESKPICVLYSAQWSRYARLLEERTLQDEEVTRLLREKFICVRLNPATEKLVAARHDAKLVPSLVFVGRDGVVLGRSVGYRQARMLADDLRRWRD